MTPEDIRDIARRLVDQAKDGDTVAIRILFDRVIGTARPEDAEPIHLDLPRGPLDAGRAAIERVVEMLASGELAPDEAASIARVIDAAVGPWLLHDIDQQIDELRAEREKTVTGDGPRIAEALDLRRALLTAVPHGLTAESGNTHLNEQRARQLRKVAAAFARWHDDRNCRGRHGNEAQEDENADDERPRSKPIRREARREEAEGTAD